MNQNIIHTIKRTNQISKQTRSCDKEKQQEKQQVSAVKVFKNHDE